MKPQSSRILVADDDKISAKALCYRLEHSGFSVAVAFDGNEALQLAQQEQFDLVIADYQMPKMLGMDLFRRLREDHRYARTSLILTSTFLDAKVVEMFEDFDLLEAIFVKPFSPAELVIRIRECLAARPFHVSPASQLAPGKATPARSALSATPKSRY
jgi:DNA-binding response OmpR family regulator